jgi:hypothetical protein
MIEGLHLSIPQRMRLARVVLTFSLIISIFLSVNLWVGSRTFPYTPVHSNFSMSGSVEVVLVVSLVVLLLLSVFMQWHRLIIFSSLVIAVVLVMSDVNRLQPWFYIYASMLLVFVFYNGRVDDSNRFTAYFIILQVILSSVYFFCGISQLNSLFIDSEFSELISPLRHFISERQFLFFKRTGVVVPYLLMFIGVGFMIAPIRYLAITLAIIIHILLLFFLFPSANNQNYALWFSNIGFGCLVLVLFSGKTKQRYFSPSYLLQVPLFYLVMFFFVIMPFFNTRGHWPDYLSSNFKSGKNKTVSFKLDKATYTKLPLYQQSFCRAMDSYYAFDYQRWCDNELNVDCFPEKPVFNSISNYLKGFNHDNVKETQLAIAGE